MRKGFFIVAVAVCILALSSPVFAKDAERAKLTKDKVIAIATDVVKGKGYKLDEVQIIYDDGNRLWSREIGKMQFNNAPNFGIFKKGFMKNYLTVYFDFKEPLPDIWVFMDKDTGEVLDVYKMK